MSGLLIRDATVADHPAVLALNRESEALMSPMDGDRLRQLEAVAACHRVIVDDDGVAGFLLAFREGAGYDSPNYRWFAQRYPRFLYIDRIAVASSRQGGGLGAGLYRDLFAFAGSQDVPMIACEFYTVPLNETSARFHARFGFTEVDREWLPNGKQVSLQAAAVAAIAQAP